MKLNLVPVFLFLLLELLAINKNGYGKRVLKAQSE